MKTVMQIAEFKDSAGGSMATSAAVKQSPVPLTPSITKTSKTTVTSINSAICIRRCLVEVWLRAAAKRDLEQKRTTIRLLQQLQPQLVDTVNNKKKQHLKQTKQESHTKNDKHQSWQ